MYGTHFTAIHRDDQVSRFQFQFLIFSRSRNTYLSLKKKKNLSDFW